MLLSKLLQIDAFVHRAGPIAPPMHQDARCKKSLCEALRMAKLTRVTLEGIEPFLALLGLPRYPAHDAANPQGRNECIKAKLPRHRAVKLGNILATNLFDQTL